MTTADILKLTENAVNWVNEGKGRQIFSARFNPSDNYSGSFRIHIVDEHNNSQFLESLADVIDPAAAARRHKLEEIARLQEELAV